MRRMCAVILRRPYSPSGVIFRFVVPSGSVTVVQAVSRTASTTIASVTVRGEIRPCRVIKHDGVWREADMLENAAEPSHTHSEVSGSAAAYLAFEYGNVITSTCTRVRTPG